MSRNTLRMAPPYEEADVAHICEQFSKLLGYAVSFDLVTEDASLLGGFRAVVDGMVYDASLSGQLDRLDGVE